MDSGLSLALSILLGSIFIITVMNAQRTVHETNIENQLESIVQEKLNHVKEVLETDLERIGNKMMESEVPGGGDFIINFTSESITFYQDTSTVTNPSGVYDTIRYSLGSTSELSHTDNPDDRILYYQVNNEPKMPIADGITHLEFKYYDQYMNLTTSTASVKAIDIEAIVALGYSHGETYNSVTGSIEDRYHQAELHTVVCPNNLGWY